MSMLCTLSRVTASQMAAMRGDPAVADQLLHEALPEVPAQPGLFARMFGKVPPAPPARLASWIGSEQQFDLDRQWHILHFLLTGQAEGGPFPASFLCDGGEEVGSDLGYGKPRLFTSEESARIAGHLRSMTEPGLFARYDTDKIEEQGVYWDAEGSPDEQREEVRALYATMMQVADFAYDTAQRACGLVVEIA